MNTDRIWVPRSLSVFICSYLWLSVAICGYRGYLWPSAAASGGGGRRGGAAATTDPRADQRERQQRHRPGDRHRRPRDRTRDRAQGFTRQRERGPEVRIGELGAALHEAQLGAAQRLVTALAALQVVIENFHELGGRTIGDLPHRRDRAARAGSQERAAEALHPFAADDPPALGVAGAEDGELDAVERQRVGLLQEQVVGAAARSGRRREHDAGALQRAVVGHGMRGQVQDRRALAAGGQERLAVVGAEMERGAPGELPRHAAGLVGGGA